MNGAACIQTQFSSRAFSPATLLYRSASSISAIKRAVRQGPRSRSSAASNRSSEKNRKVAQRSFKDRGFVPSSRPQQHRDSRRDPLALETRPKWSAERRVGIEERSVKRRTLPGPKWSAERRDGTEERSIRQRRLPSPDRSAERREGTEEHSVKRRTLPMSIHYTTSSSEFLYGTSVVLEALKSDRRKPHVLYVYDGQNREESGQRRLAEKLARDRRVLVQQLPDPDLMSKMSKGRPHNVGEGCHSNPSATEESWAEILQGMYS